ncbi:MAG: hypothetical protein VR78_06090 [Hoeflea sp. BRH_c9]|nr:MAG: hypothetical protein VR78_06090 [Hoeflea sp. BRH_c9]
MFGCKPARSSDPQAFPLLWQLDTDVRTALLDGMMRIASAQLDVATGEDRWPGCGAGLDMKRNWA